MASRMAVIVVADLFYTLTEAATLLGVNRLTVRRWIDSGRLESQRVGGVVLIERDVIDAQAAHRSALAHLRRAPCEQKSK